MTRRNAGADESRRDLERRATGGDVAAEAEAFGFWLEEALARENALARHGAMTGEMARRFVAAFLQNARKILSPPPETYVDPSDGGLRELYDGRRWHAPQGGPRGPRDVIEAHCNDDGVVVGTVSADPASAAGGVRVEAVREFRFSECVYALAVLDGEDATVGFRAARSSGRRVPGSANLSAIMGARHGPRSSVEAPGLRAWLDELDGPAQARLDRARSRGAQRDAAREWNGNLAAWARRQAEDRRRVSLAGLLAFVGGEEALAALLSEWERRTVARVREANAAGRVYIPEGAGYPTNEQHRLKFLAVRGIVKQLRWSSTAGTRRWHGQEAYAMADAVVRDDEHGHARVVAVGGRTVPADPLLGLRRDAANRSFGHVFEHPMAGLDGPSGDLGVGSVGEWEYGAGGREWTLRFSILRGERVAASRARFHVVFAEGSAEPERAWTEVLRGLGPDADEREGGP